MYRDKFGVGVERYIHRNLSFSLGQWVGLIDIPPMLIDKCEEFINLYVANSKVADFAVKESPAPMTELNNDARASVALKPGEACNAAERIAFQQ